MWDTLQKLIIRYLQSLFIAVTVSDSPCALFVMAEPLRIRGRTPTLRRLVAILRRVVIH